jgi:hypothetical protein
MFQSFLGGLFGTGGKTTNVLVLRPDATGKTLNGFHGGADLRVPADYPGQTVAELLDKFNVYRSPDQQIKRVWGPSGHELSSKEVVGELIAFVRGASVNTV